MHRPRSRRTLSSSRPSSTGPYTLPARPRRGSVTDVVENHVHPGDSVVVDIGGKSEGVIPRSEFAGTGSEINVKEGDKVDVFIESRENDDGLVTLSKEKADKMKVWDEISSACERDELIEGTISQRVKGGLSVTIRGGVKAFLPGSQVIDSPRGAGPTGTAYPVRAAPRWGSWRRSAFPLERVRQPSKGDVQVGPSAADIPSARWQQRQQRSREHPGVGPERVAVYRFVIPERELLKAPGSCRTGPPPGRYGGPSPRRPRYCTGGRAQRLATLTSRVTVANSEPWPYTSWA